MAMMTAFSAAAWSARRALAVPARKKEVEVKAEGWLATGRSLVNSNPEKAKRLLRQVTEVFPSRDARYIEAYGVLKRIDSEDDD